MANLFERVPAWCVRIAAAFITLFGLIVMIAWYRRLAAPAQMDSVFVTMQFNTAVGFLLAGSGLGALSVRRLRTAAILGAIVAALGLLTGSQYLTGSDLGIDQLFMPHTVVMSYPGRMAPNAALGFILSGITLVLLGGIRQRRYQYPLAEILASLTAGIAILGLVGHAVGIEHAYGWGEMTPMGLRTAAALLVLGTGLFVQTWITEFLSNARTGRWMSFPIAVAAVAVLFSFWHALSLHEQRRIHLATEVELIHFGGLVQSLIDDRVRALERMAARWNTDARTSRSDWAADAAEYLSDYAGYKAVGWADKRGRVRWEMTASNEAAGLGFVPTIPDDGQSHIVLPRSTEHLTAGDILVVMPVEARDRPDGALFAVLNLENMLPPLAKPTERYVFRLRAGEREILHAGNDPSIDQWVRRITLPIRNKAWTLEMWPTRMQLAEQRTPLYTMVLISGIAVAVLLIAAVHLAQMAARRARMLSRLNQDLGEAQERLKRLAMFDSLTGIGNRNLFRRELRRATATAARLGQPVGLLMMDLNGFKAVNDELGHQAGDMVLQQVALRIVQLLRVGDQVFRIGGDEFAAVLQPGTDLPQSLVTARRIKEAMEEPIELRGERRCVGISIGAAAFPAQGTDLDHLVRIADLAMYEAKTAGAPMTSGSEAGPMPMLVSLGMNEAS
ncbi:hypothetical protein BH24PSE2_BH24PSE2_11400 [soil metagenome]